MEDSKRNILATIGGVSAIAGITSGTGAFSSIKAERGITVDVVGDASAFLALEPAAGPNGKYATVSTDGLLEVQISEENNRIQGEGVNLDARTNLGEVFRITNQGTQPVGVWIEHDSNYIEFTTNGKRLDDSASPVFVEAGNSLPVCILVNTRQYGEGTGTLLEEVTIHADANPDSNHPAPRDINATRTIEDEAVLPRGSTIVTISIENIPDGVEVDVYEKFDVELGTASFESASVNDQGVSPSFVDLATGGGIVLFDEIDSGSLTVAYSVQIASGAPDGMYSLNPNLIEVDGEAIPIKGAKQIEVDG